MQVNSSKLIEDHIFFAELIALDYANIPGCQWDEAKSEAYMGLIRASEAYDPQKGEFTAFASKVIRNALNSLYAKQLRILKIFPKSLDEPIVRWKSVDHSISSDCDTLHSIAPDITDVRKEIRNNEATAALDAVMNLLSPRERMAIEALRIGKNYPEIGESMGISKQAAHKSAQSGLEKLRNGLARLGYKGIASDGFLDSRKKEITNPG
jgi:RNA polymerase sigma factor (sigma-70 family)